MGGGSFKKRLKANLTTAKATTKRYKSDAFEAIHASAAALHQVGAMPKATMRKFDAACLIPVPQYTPEDVQRIRLSHHLSQPVFARFLNTSESTIQKWEAGSKRPSGMACRLLAVVERHGLEVLA